MFACAPKCRCGRWRFSSDKSARHANLDLQWRAFNFIRAYYSLELLCLSARRGQVDSLLKQQTCST